MRKIERFFTLIALFLVVFVAGGGIWTVAHRTSEPESYQFPESKYGTFLAAQHAIAINDFETAMSLSNSLQDTNFPAVANVKTMAAFLNGQMPENAENLKKEKNLFSRFAYDAYLVKNGKWDEFHSRHKTEESALVAPFRIWSAIANNWRTNTFKYIDGLATNDSWKSFVRGQIYAELGDIKTAAEHFAKVTPEFMNINDYLYLMSFYSHHDMSDRAGDLLKQFTSRPTGVFMLDYDKVPDWSVYSGYANQLAFSLVQTVSHTNILMHSDMAVLMLRFAQVAAPEFAQNSDSINYYLGQYFYTNGGNYNVFFEKIDENSPFYLFTVLRNTEKTGDIDNLERALKNQPLFVPAINKLVGYYIQQGKKRSALSVVNHALADEGLDYTGRAFFLKSRAYIYYVFGDYKAAQKDLTDAFYSLIPDAEMYSLQAKIWAAQNKEIEMAYEYTKDLILNNPTDILAWDTLGCVVAVREGLIPALEIMESVGAVAQTHSPLFMHLGDIYMSLGDKDKARDAYMRAIDLSDDGLVVVPEIERKLRKIK